jgi:tRNA threonylcarbamoyladenosine biosynthesis protein TsaE
VRPVTTLRVVTDSPKATREIAGGVGSLVAPGDMILLSGDLGAGKTTFTQGLAESVGVRERVTSPTFTLVHLYEGAGKLRLLHADVYRLEHLQEVVDLGLPEMIDDGAVAVIEWGDVAASVLLPDHLDVRLEFGAHDDERLISLCPVGARWAGRMPRLAEATGGTSLS